MSIIGIIVQCLYNIIQKQTASPSSVLYRAALTSDLDVAMRVYKLSLWWHDIAVTRFIQSTKLLYTGPG